MTQDKKTFTVSILNHEQTFNLAATATGQILLQSVQKFIQNKLEADYRALATIAVLYNVNRSQISLSTAAPSSSLVYFHVPVSFDMIPSKTYVPLRGDERASKARQRILGRKVAQHLSEDIVLVHGRNLLSVGGALDVDEVNPVLQQILPSLALYVVTVYEVKGYASKKSFGGLLVRRFGHNRAEFWKDIIQGKEELRETLSRVTDDKLTKANMFDYHTLRTSHYRDESYYPYIGPINEWGSASLFRVCRGDEDPETGLVAKNPFALHISVGGHCSGTKTSTPYISTFSRFAFAVEWMASYFVRHPQEDEVTLAVIDPKEACGRILKAANHVEESNILAYANANREKEVAICGFVPPSGLQSYTITRHSLGKYIKFLKSLPKSKQKPAVRRIAFANRFPAVSGPDDL